MVQMKATRFPGITTASNHPPKTSVLSPNVLEDRCTTTVETESDKLQNFQQWLPHHASTITATLFWTFYTIAVILEDVNCALHSTQITQNFSEHMQESSLSITYCITRDWFHVIREPAVLGIIYLEITHEQLSTKQLTLVQQCHAILLAQQ